MADIKPQGKYAIAALESIRAAEALQGMAVAKISEDFAAVHDDALSLEQLTWKNFVDDISNASENDTMDDLNNQLLMRVLGPVITQVFLEKQQEGAQ